MQEQLDPRSIRLIQWGDVHQEADGRWVTSWTVELEVPCISDLAEVTMKAANESAGFFPVLQMVSDRAIHIDIETVRWGMEIDYYALTYELFKLIDAQLGRIRFIQGSPRDWWQPFRSCRPEGQSSDPAKNGIAKP